MLLDIHSLTSLERIGPLGFKLNSPVVQYEFSLWGAEAGAKRKFLDAYSWPFQPAADEFTLSSIDEAMQRLVEERSLPADTRTALWRELSALRGIIPAGARVIITRFNAGAQWQVHMFLSRAWAAGNERAVRELPPVLLLPLACLDQFTGDTRGVAHARALELAACGQREILAAAGFTKNPRSAAKILGKLDVQSCTCETLKAIRSMYNDPGAESFVKLLRHLPHISAPLVRLLSDTETMPIVLQVETKLLMEMGTMARDETDALIREIKDTVGMARECGMNTEALRFTSRQQVKRQHDAQVYLVNHYSLPELLAMKFPDPPKQGNERIVPLTTPQMVAEEGISQGNCVIGYIRRVAGGGIYLYRVNAPERATMSLIQYGNKWSVGELSGRFNQPVAWTTREAVHAWLDNRPVRERLSPVVLERPVVEMSYKVIHADMPAERKDIRYIMRKFREYRESIRAGHGRLLSTDMPLSSDHGISLP